MSEPQPIDFMVGKTVAAAEFKPCDFRPEATLILTFTDDSKLMIEAEGASGNVYCEDLWLNIAWERKIPGE